MLKLNSSIPMGRTGNAEEMNGCHLGLEERDGFFILGDGS